MSNHDFAKNMRYLLQRNPEQRSLNGRIHYASANTNMDNRHVLENVIDASEHIVLTTGCGLPDSIDHLPVRFPSLIVPGLEMIRSYKKSFGGQDNITYQVYQAGDFIKKVNNLSNDKIAENAAFMQSYLTEFTNEFYSDIAEYVQFDFQKDVALDELDPIIDFLKSTKDEQAQDYIKKINDYSNHDKGRGCFYTYAAANIYFNGLNDLPVDKPTTIIPVGGQKEKPFFYLTSLYHQEQVDNKKVLPVTFNCQRLPSYFPYKQGDLTIGQIAGNNFDDVVKQSEKLSHPALSDFQDILAPIGATLPRLIEMADAVKKSHALICA